MVHNAGVVVDVGAIVNNWKPLCGLAKLRRGINR